MKLCFFFFITLLVLRSTSAYPSLEFEGIFSTQYIHNINQEERDKYDYFGLYSDFSLQNLKSPHQFRIYGKFNYFIDHELFLHEYPEFYYRLNHPSWSFGIGRQILPWSDADHYWKLGLLNNRLGWDLFDPGQVGLIVAQLGYKSTYTKINFIGSYLYMPELYPGYVVEDGKLVCNSINCNNDLQYIRFNTGKTVPIVYGQRELSAQDVLFKPTAGFFFKYQDKNSFDIFYFYKPENKFRIQVNSFVDPKSGDFVAAIDFNMLQHHVFGFDFEMPFKNSWQINFANITTLPDYSTASDVSDQYVSIKDVAMNQSFWHLSLNGNTESFKFSVGYLKEIIQTYDKTFDDIPVGELPRYYDALKLRIDYLLPYKSNLYLDYTYNLPTQDFTWETSLRFAYLSPMLVTAKVQIIQAGDKASFWWPYQAEDRIYLTLGYKW